MTDFASGDLLGRALSTHKHVKQAADELIKRGLIVDKTRYRNIDQYSARFTRLYLDGGRLRRFTENCEYVLKEFYELTSLFWCIACDDIVLSLRNSLKDYDKIMKVRYKFLALKRAPDKEHYVNLLSDQEKLLSLQKTTPSMPADFFTEDWDVALSDVKKIFSSLESLETEIDRWVIIAKTKTDEAKKMHMDRVRHWTAISGAILGSGLVVQLGNLIYRSYKL